MTKIDETTGLLAVPEDMFWRVEESTIPTTYQTSVGGVKVRLMKTTVTEIPSNEQIRSKENGFWARLFTGKQYRDVTIVTEGRTETTVDSVSYRDLIKYTKEIPEGSEHDWTSYREYNYYDGYETKFYRVIPATPENLLESSLLVWEHYIGIQHSAALEEGRKRDLDRVLGDYPPKSIKGLVTA